MVRQKGKQEIKDKINTLEQKMEEREKREKRNNIFKNVTFNVDKITIGTVKIFKQHSIS